MGKHDDFFSEDYWRRLRSDSAKDTPEQREYKYYIDKYESMTDEELEEEYEVWVKKGTGTRFSALTAVLYDRGWFDKHNY